MFVCVCKAVRSKEVTELIHSGANSVEAIGQSCGAGTDCGSCVRRIQRMLSQTTCESPKDLVAATELPEKKAV